MWLYASSLILAAGPARPATPDPLLPRSYLEAQLYNAETALRAGRPAEALDGVDRALSLVASLQNPEDDPEAVALAISRALGVLVPLKQTERAWGLHRAAGGFVETALPDGAAGGFYRITVAGLLEAQNETAGAFAAADEAVSILRRAGFDDESSGLLADALVLRRILCLALARPECPSAPTNVMALPRGPAGREARLELGRRLAAMDRSGALPGSWHRPGALERWVVGEALAEAPATDPEIAFLLFQAIGRQGASFDADALTALSHAQTEPARRSIHQTLRLRARRDRLERAQIQNVVALAARPAAAKANLRYDAGQRMVFRDFAVRLADAEAELAKAGVALSGANLVPLRRFQALLAPDEAALAAAPTPEGLAYMCVRRDATHLATAPVDAASLKLDGRLVQAALTATHAPSEATDTQFPAPAAVRLYDALIRPFEGCLKPGDRIVWLPAVATVPVPLATLLRTAPPKLPVGYDLAGADWLVRRHAVSYAGSAAVIVAARSGPAPAGGAFDFLGVGDPVLTGETLEGEVRGRALLRSVRGEYLAELAPLPETKDELEVSAQGFRRARLLLQGEATERRLRGELVGAYRFLSFATHGLIREDLQGLSEPALVLTPVSMADPTNDGLLTASEIADLQLSARFVALSACNTANFDLTQMSQDLPALASAFAIAGAPSTLGTLWPVNSDTGKQVVSGIFGRLRDAPGAGPAAALAGAQRAFLADPPGRAYLHPRFWAPFVVLGEGGALPAGADAGGAPRVTAAEVLTARGGEVLHVGRQRGHGVVARFISDKDDAGRHGAGLRLTRRDGEAWRRDIRDVGATRFTAGLGGRILVSGYGTAPGPRFHPVLELFDSAGERVAAWRGGDLSDTHAFVFGGTKRGPGEAVVLVGELRHDGRSSRLTLLSVDERLQPRRLAEIQAPSGGRLENATVSPLRDDLVVTYTASAPRLATTERPLDDYDVPVCGWERVTWIERRDGRTGELQSRRQVRGLNVVEALGGADGVWVAGSTRPACGGETRAVVLAMDGALNTRPLWADETLGASEVRALGALPDGRAYIAASKEAVFDIRLPAIPGATPDPYRLGDLPKSFGGMVVVLARDGRASAPRMLEAGGSVFVTSIDASDPRDVLVGGTLGGEAAIFHLATEKP